MWKSLPLLVLSLLLLLSLPSLVHASSIQPPPVTKCSGWEYENLANSTYVGLPASTCLYADSVWANYNGLGYVYFSEASLQSSTNPSQTFGITSGNTGTVPVNITAITSTTIGFAAKCPSGTCYLFYYYTSIFGSTTVATTTIPFASYYASEASFKAATPPAVYSAPSGYLEVSFTGTQTVTFASYSTNFGTFSYSVVGGGSPTAPTLTYYYQGTQEVVSLGFSPTQYAMDGGSTWTVSPNPLSGSTTHERWAATSPVLSGTVTSGAAFTESYTFYHQYQGNFSDSLTGGTRTPTNTIPLFYVQYGGTTQLFLTSSYQPVWIDAGSTWHVDNPSYSNLQSYVPNPASGSMTSKLQQNIAFTAGNSCSGPNPLVLIQQGCVIPGVVATLDAPIGLQPWFGFIVFGIAIAVYNKTQSVMMLMLIVWVSGAAFGFLIPSYAIPLAQILLYLGTAALVLKIVFRFW